MTHRSPFQPLLFCDSVKIVLRLIQMIAPWGYLLGFSPGPQTSHFSGVSPVVLMEKADLSVKSLHMALPASPALRK